MNYLTIKEIKEKYWYNQYQLQNLRKNNKVSFKEKPFMYLEEDIIKAKKENFNYETICKTHKFNLWKYVDLISYENYMKEFWKEFRRVLFWMLKGKFNMELNEYSKHWPFNSYDNRSLFTLVQWEASRYQEQWKNMKENFDKWKKWKTKKEINDRKLYLERSFQKIRIKRKDFLYFIGDDETINIRMKIENWYLYVPDFNKPWKRRKKFWIWGYWGEWKQTITITKNKNWKLVASVTFYVKKKNVKYKWVCWLDLNLKNISATCVDFNGCLKKRKIFPFKNIRNLKNKKVEMMKLLLEIKKWAWNYSFVMEDLNLSNTKKWRETSNFFYKQIFDNSFMFWDVKFVNPAYTSFIWISKYSNLWLSKSHWILKWRKYSKDNWAAMCIARRWLWFKEKLPKFSCEEKMNNWKSWSYLKKNFWVNWTINLFWF